MEVKASLETGYDLSSLLGVIPVQLQSSTDGPRAPRLSGRPCVSTPGWRGWRERWTFSWKLHC